MWDFDGGAFGCASLVVVLVARCWFGDLVEPDWWGAWACLALGLTLVIIEHGLGLMFGGWVLAGLELGLDAWWGAWACLDLHLCLGLILCLAVGFWLVLNLDLLDHGLGFGFECGLGFGLGLQLGFGVWFLAWTCVLAN